MTEDYTTYTEYDTSNVIDVISSTSLSYNSVESRTNKEYLLFKDYDDGYFSSCTLEADGEVTDITCGGGRCKSSIIIFGLSYTDGQPNITSSLGYSNYAWNTGGWTAYFFNPTDNSNDLDIKLSCKNLTSTDTYAGASVNTRYWFTAEHESSSVTLYIYDDAARSSLVDTLVVSVDNLPYSHIIGGGSMLTGQNPRSFMSGDVKNLTIDSVTSESLPSPDTSNCVDYTSFTEVDAGTEVEIVNSTLIEVDVNERKVEDYVYRNYGVDYFSSIKHQVESEVTQITYVGGASFPGGFCIWGVRNNVDEMFANMNNEGIVLYWHLDDYRDLYIKIRDFSGGDDSDSYNDAVAGWKYYFTIERSESSNICTCKIYKEADRSTLLDTLSISCATISFQYVYAESGWYYGGADTDYGVGGEIRYLKFLEINAPDDPGEGGPTDYASNAEFPTSDLNVTIPEGEDEVDVTFYDEDGNEIGSTTGEGGETVSVPWNDLECEEEYGWYVVMDNGESTSTSPIWYFTCGSCNVFTIASESHPTIHLYPPRFRDGEQKNLNKVIRRFGFWSEQWDTYDEGIDSEPLTLIGWEWIDEDGDLDIFHVKFTDIHDIMNNHEEVAISGLGDCIDGYYYIKNFHFNTVRGAPRIRQWKLQLEFSRDKTW